MFGTSRMTRSDGPKESDLEAVGVDKSSLPTSGVKLPAAADVYALVRARIDPTVGPLGYLREKAGPPTWGQGKSANPTTAFWAQVNPKAIDPFSGGELLFEFERKVGGRTAAKLSGRARLDQLLDKSQMLQVITYQNSVIASMPRPPMSQIQAYPESLREMYLREFEPQGAFRPGNLWLRYQTMAHIEGWLNLMALLLPEVLGRADRLDPHRMYMGRPIDLDATPLLPATPLATN